MNTKPTKSTSIITDRIGAFTLSPVGLISARSVSLDEWLDVGKALARVGSGVQWWIGDWLNYGEGRPEWGEKYEKAMEMFNMAEQTLKNMKWVSGAIELSRRRDNLSWKHHATVAYCAPKDQCKLLGLALKSNWSVAKLKAEMRERLIEADECDLPAGTYRVLYADPPWKYSDQLIDGYGAAEHHYRTLTIEELCDLPIAALARPNAVLFLWATSPILKDAFAVIEAWGFEYKTSFVWDKVKHNFGHYNSVRHELLLLATRGSCTPDSKTLHDSVVECARDAKHSRKPPMFYTIIEKMYERGPRIELFARHKREGWKQWGNQLQTTTTVTTLTS